jgi:ATP-binding cassette, subfamily G (WHITE), member 2, PDR
MLEAIGAGSRKRIGPKDWAEVCWPTLCFDSSFSAESFLPQIYLDSPEFQENKRMIEKIKSDSLASNHEEEGPAVVRTEYATPWLYQLKIVTLRTFRSFWRQADYGFT